MRKHFQEFLSRAHVIELVVGTVLGLARGRIVASLASDVPAPSLGLLLRGAESSNLFIDGSDRAHTTLIAARQDGAVTQNYELLFSTVLNFLIVATGVCLLLRQIHHFTASGPRRSLPRSATTPCLASSALR